MKKAFRVASWLMAVVLAGLFLLPSIEMALFPEGVTPELKDLNLLIEGWSFRILKIVGAVAVILGFVGSDKPSTRSDQA